MSDETEHPDGISNKITNSVGTFIGDITDSTITVTVIQPSESIPKGFLKPREACALFDRASVDKWLDLIEKNNSIARAFFIGEEIDWHEGVNTRISEELRHVSKRIDTSLYYISVSEESENYALDIWREIAKSIPIPTNKHSVESIKNDVERIFSDRCSVNPCKIVLNILINPRIPFASAKIIIKDISDTFTDIDRRLNSGFDEKIINVGVAFNIISYSWFERLFDINQSKAPVQYTKEFPDFNKIHLSPISIDDIDGWILKLERHEKNIGSLNNQWWSNLRMCTKKHFGRFSFGIRHKKLLDRLSDDHNFSTCLDYKETT